MPFTLITLYNTCQSQLCQAGARTGGESKEKLEYWSDGVLELHQVNQYSITPKFFVRRSFVHL